jgi:NADH-quinone oxidoreductase subunit C
LVFQFLTDITGVHYPDRKGEELAVVYHVHNLKENVRLRIKIFVSIEKPDVFTATGLFSGANWMERETYDFFGVNFIGHPDLRRVLNVDEMDYFPLRKEYPLEDQTRIDKDDEMFGR